MGASGEAPEVESGDPRHEPIAVIGAGSIGTSWAIVFARVGHPVALYDPDPQRRAAAQTEILERLTVLAEAELVDEPPGPIAARVTMHAELQTALVGAVHVQECAPEQLALKRALFAELDALASPEAVLASSSSAITISETAATLSGRARCLVVHPANPPHLLPVVELVPAAFTDPDVVERTAAMLSAAEMSPVRVNVEIEGFVYNRLQGALLREAYCLVRDGVISVDELDRIVREGLGRRWAVIGPFETSDLNTRGGIAVHAPRMRDTYARMGAIRGQYDPWTDELIERVTEQRRALMPLSEWDQRVAWRDQVLVRLEQARRQLDRPQHGAD
jgi:3-hydroxyacyl-CoA dehydrogenase